MAIKRFKDGKSPRRDDNHGEILNLLEASQTTVITKLLNNTYETGHLPKDSINIHSNFQKTNSIGNAQTTD